MFKQFCFAGCLLLTMQWLHGQQPRLMLPIGHTGKLTSVHVTRDERKILTSSYDGTAKLWDVQSGTVLIDFNIATTPGSEPDVIYFAEFSANEKMIVTTGSEGTATVWDVATGKILALFPTRLDGYQKAARFSADQKHIFTFNSEGVTKWEIATKKKVINRRVTFSFGPVAVSGDDRKIIIGASDEKTGCRDFVLDLLTGKRTCLPFPLHQAQFEQSTNKLQLISKRGLVDVLDTSIYSRAGSWDQGSNGEIYDPKKMIVNGFFTPDSKLAVLSYGDSSVKIVTLKPARKTVTLQNCNAMAAAMPPAYANPLIAVSADGKKVAVGVKNFNVGIWSTETGRLLTMLKGHTDYVSDIEFFPDSRRLVTSANDNSGIIWDTETSQAITSLSGKASTLTKAHFSGPNKIIVCFNDTLIKVLDLDNGTLLPDIKPGLHFGVPLDVRPFETVLMSLSDSMFFLINPVAGDTILKYEAKKYAHEDGSIGGLTFSKSKRRVYLAYERETLEKLDALVIDPLTSEVILRPTSEKQGYEVDFSADDKYLLRIEEDSKLAVWDIETGKIIFTTDAENKKIKEATFSPDGKKIVGLIYSESDEEGEIRVWEIATGKLLLKLKPGTNDLDNLQFNPGGTEMIVRTGFRDIRFFDLNSGKALATIKSASVSFLGWYSGDGKYFMTSSENMNTRIWNAKTYTLVKEFNLPGYAQDVTPDFKQVICIMNPLVHIYNTVSGKIDLSFAIADSANYVSLLPSGYYRSSTGGAKSLYYVTNDLNIVSFDQLDVKYNRPDRVLTALGSRDAVLINAYRNAYLKRIKKLDIDTSSFREGFNIPEADIQNRNSIPARQTTKTLKLVLTAAGKGQPIDRYNIWVNEVPVYGIRGVNVRNKNSETISQLPVDITLSKGMNKIEFSVTSTNGIESYRKPLFITYTPAEQQPEKVFFVGIGISQFADTSYNLQYCDKDITDLSDKLKQKYGDRLQSYVLLNNKVNIENIKALKEKLQACTEEDKVIIAYSGHGLLSKSYDYYLSTYAVNFNRPEQNGLAYDELENLVDGIKSRKKLMLIDACHSGEIDKEEMQKIAAVQSTLKKKGVVAGGKGIKVLVTESNVGTKNSFALMQELFVNVGKGTGTSIISAAAGTQFALEKGELKNGVFTSSILELLDSKHPVTVNTLKAYVSKRVSELTNGLQQPTTRNETQQSDWFVW